MVSEKRLIDRNEIFPNGTFFANAEDPMKSLDELIARIWSIPTVDAVEVVHGRWEWLGPNRLVPECMCGTCSACKVRSKYIVNTAICPNCGAKMDLK